MKNWNGWGGLFVIIAIMAVMAIASAGCGGDDDDDQASDDLLDDDDDNTADDGSDDDDDTGPFGDPPQISTARWRSCEEQPAGSDYEWVGEISFFVCDPDDNLAGGHAYLYYGFSDELYLPPQNIRESFPNISDCENPPLVWWSELEFTPDDNGQFYVDLLIKDGVGNESNRIVGVGTRDCVN